MTIRPPRLRMKRVFTEGITAIDIAEPLLSFDYERDSEKVRAFMVANGLELVGVRQDGATAGYVTLESLQGGMCGSGMQAFPAGAMLREGASLRDVIALLSENKHVFITVLGHVAAMVSRRDVQKPPVRMWLFGMITIMEMNLVRLISTKFPDGTWRKYLSEGRLQKAIELQEERNRRGEHVELLDCLQLPDKAAVFIKDPEIRGQSEYKTKGEAARAVKRLESLRNNLAHSQDITSENWEAIAELSARVDRIIENSERTTSWDKPSSPPEEQ